MSEQQSIKETLSVIRKALEDDNDIKPSDEDILILNRVVKDDGTIDVIDNDNLNSEDVKNLLDKKIDEIFDKNISKWLDKKIPLYLEKYIKSKKL
tara:strand:+ start:1683 stop:1967 length:285 start_codon:yes stop_codon:yes gene_type:complete